MNRMFTSFKNKLKGVLNKFSKEVEEDAKVVEETKEEEATPEKVEVPEEIRETIKEELETTPKKASEEQKEEPEEVPEETKKVVEEKPVDEPTKESEDTKESQEVIDEEPEEKRGFFKKLFKKKKSDEETVIEETITDKGEFVEEKTDELPEELQETTSDDEEKPKKEGFFKKLTKITLSEEKFESLFWEIEVTLLENNVAVEVIEKIKADLKEALTGEKFARKSVQEIITDTLKNTIKEIVSIKQLDLLAQAEEKNKAGKPLIITMIGVNGSGKTTTLAKLVKYFQNNNKSVVVAAADTFRAAAIQQVEEHTNKLGVKLIKHDYNADPAAVAFDAIKHATAKNIDVVLIDSAGRLHSNDNLMNELKKLIRINTPDINIFVGEAITGNDCVEQATLFDEAVGIDAIILAKADVDEKGGAAISASYVTKKPVIFLGVGQTYDDLKPFDATIVLESLGL